MLLRRTAIAAALAVTAFLVAPPAAAQARACKIDHVCYLDFYSDSTHTELVGGILTYCDGSTQRWGVRTGYQEFSESPC